MHTWDERVAWYEENLRIRTKEARLEPFRLNRIQLALERAAWEAERDARPFKAIVLKARQEGVSTWSTGHIFRRLRDSKDWLSMVIAHKEDATRNIFGMSRRYLEHLPDKPPTVRHSARVMEFEDTGSSLVVETAGSGAMGGRSFTVNGLHLSELDFYPDPEELLGGVMQTVPDNENTFVVVESTANGPMGAMQQEWDRAKDGRSDYIPFFFAWFDHEEYRRPVTWADLRAYGDRQWVAQHRALLDKKVAEEEKDGLGSWRKGLGYGSGDGDGGRSEEAPEGDRRAEAGPPGDATGEGRGAEGAEGPAAGHGQGRGRTQEAGDRARGRDARRPGRRDRRAGDDGPPAPAEAQRGVPEVGGDGREGVPPVGGVGTGKTRRIDQWFGGDEQLEFQFRDSLTPYEQGLIAEHELTLEQINWYRWCFETKCRGDEIRMKREYPSRDEEAFQATGADVLDPQVLAEWAKDAKDNPPIVIGEMVGREVRLGQIMAGVDPDTRNGPVAIWKNPDPKDRYVMGVDCASGQNVAEGDWHVGVVLSCDTGEQVAEYRSKHDPDLAVDQIELLAIYYDCELVAIEKNSGWGVPFLRHLSDRGTVKLYETETYDRFAKKYMKTPGWNTTTKTRPVIVTETKESVRNRVCKLRSLETINECRTLHENAVGKIEARDGKHDDGWIAYGIAAIMRNKVLGLETRQEREDRKQSSFVVSIQEAYKRKRREETKEGLSAITARIPVPQRAVAGVSVRPDGRRSVL